MNITGIIAEYNPFHMGHEYQLKKARELTSCEAIAVVMSGNYVQRGEPAIIDKYRRAESAIYGGADIVIELPMPFACQNAEMFANAAIQELKKLNINTLSFGCESTNTELLKSIATMQLDTRFNKYVKEEIKKGLSYPKALSSAIEHFLGKEAVIISSSPNNVLVIEYIKSIIRHNLKIGLAPVKRIGKNHNDIRATGNFDSATAIRNLILNGNLNNLSITKKSKEKIQEFYKEHNCYNNLNNYLDLIYYKIIDIGLEGLNNIFEVNEGLNNKIYDNVFKHENIDDFIMSLKSKRYTYSKLRRTLLNILLGITTNEIHHIMPNNYVKVLAFNDIGRQVIKEAKKNGTVIINRYSDYKKNNIEIKNNSLFKLTNKTTNIYNIPLKNRNNNEEYINNAIYVKI